MAVVTITAYSIGFVAVRKLPTHLVSILPLMKKVTWKELIWKLVHSKGVVSFHQHVEPNGECILAV